MDVSGPSGGCLWVHLLRPYRQGLSPLASNAVQGRLCKMAFVTRVKVDYKTAVTFYLSWLSAIIFVR